MSLLDFVAIECIIYPLLRIYGWRRHSYGELHGGTSSGLGQSVYDGLLVQAVYGIWLKKEASFRLCFMAGPPPNTSSLDSFPILLFSLVTVYLDLGCLRILKSRIGV